MNQSKARTAYISGPMTGLDNHNFAAFNEAAQRWERLGFVCINPANNFGGATHHPRPTYMRMDVMHVLMSDVLVLLPGWDQSKGACLEALLAVELGLDVFLEEQARWAFREPIAHSEIRHRASCGLAGVSPALDVVTKG